MATTSLLIPTRTELISTRYTPAELADVTAFDAFFLDDTKPVRFEFVLALWAAYTAGETTVTHDFETYADAAAAKVFLENVNYGYTVTAVSPPNTSITVSWA